LAGSVRGFDSELGRVRVLALVLGLVLGLAPGLVPAREQAQALARHRLPGRH
jgi:hypothetical protein